MLNNRTIPIRSGLLALATAVLVVAWSVSRTAAEQVPTQGAAAPDGKAAAPPGPGGPASEEPPTEAERAIDLAISKISKLVSVSAELEQDVDMLNQKFKIVGQYMKAPNNHVYMSLKIGDGLPDSSGTLLQVCDGETLWDVEDVLGQAFYRKQSIKPILERLNSPDLDPEIRAKALTQMGMAGPETLLAGLRKTLRFDIKDKEPTVLNNRKVWRFHGTWRSRQGLTLESRPVSPIGALPPYIPMDGILYLGVDDGWPYQLNLDGRAQSDVYDTRRVGPDGRPIGAKHGEKIPRSSIKLVYTEVKLNTPIRNDEFAFQPPANASVADDTEMIQKTLDRALEVAAQKKKADAASKDGELLKQPIDVPAASGAPGGSKPPE